MLLAHSVTPMNQSLKYVDFNNWECVYQTVSHSTHFQIVCGLSQILGSTTGKMKATWLSTNLQDSAGGFRKNHEKRKEWETNGLWTANLEWNKEQPLKRKKSRYYYPQFIKYSSISKEIQKTHKTQNQKWLLREQWSMSLNKGLCITHSPFFLLPHFFQRESETFLLQYQQSHKTEKTNTSNAKQ